MAPEDAETVLGGRYRLLRKLGSGGMAAVFLAEDSVLGRKVALKRLHADSAEDAVRRFDREAQITAGLSHPNLVAVFDAFSEGEDLVVVMEYVDGSDLAKATATHQVIEDEVRVRVLADVAAALDHVHSAGIVHRDVKPSNVLLADGSFQAKLTDLGIAKVVEDTATTQTNIVPGSLAYMAPEQLANKPVSPATDIYALALIAHELFSGERGRSGGWAQISHDALNEPAPDVREARPDFPAGAALAIQAGLARDPGDRPRSATALVEQIEGELESGDDTVTDERTATIPVAAPAPAPAPAAPSRAAERVRAETRQAPPSPSPRPSTPAPSAPRRSGSSRWPWVAALAAVALAAVAGVLLLGGGEDGGSGGEPAPAQQAESSGGSGGGGNEASTGGGSGSAPEEASPPEDAVAGFYEEAAAGDFAAATEVASPNLAEQLGGEGGIAATFDTLESISFESLKTTSESGDSAEVAFSTTAEHTDRTESCNGSATLVLSDGTWLVDQLNNVSCDETG